MPVRAPAVRRPLRRIVVGEIAVRQFDRHVGFHIAEIFVRQRFPVIFEMVEDVEALAAPLFDDRSAFCPGNLKIRAKSCHKAGGRTARALGDLSDDPSARSTGDFALDLANAG